MKFNPVPLSWFTSLLISTRFENVVAEECEAESDLWVKLILPVVIMCLICIALTVGWVITCVFLFVKKGISKPAPVSRNVDRTLSTKRTLPKPDLVIPNSKAVQVSPKFTHFMDINEFLWYDPGNPTKKGTFDCHSQPYEIMKPVDRKVNRTMSTPNLRERIVCTDAVNFGDREPYAYLK